MFLTAEALKIGDLVKHRNDFGYIEENIGLRYFVEWFATDRDFDLGRSTETHASVLLLRKEYLEWERENIK